MSAKKTGLSREDNTKIQSLIKFLENKPESYEFLRPVDYKGLGLLDYTTLILKPMDISTVKKNLKYNVYSTLNEAVADLMLIWENCKTYNPKELTIYKQAEKMEQYMMGYFANHSWELSLLEKRPRESAPSSVTLQNKIDFVEALEMLPEEEVGRVLEVLFANCPRAIIKQPDDKIQVKVDNIDEITFYKVYE